MLAVFIRSVLLCSVSSTVGLANADPAAIDECVCGGDMQCPEQSPCCIGEIVSLLQLPSDSRLEERLSTDTKHQSHLLEARKVFSLSQAAARKMWARALRTGIDVWVVVSTVVLAVVFFSMIVLSCRVLIDATSPTRKRSREEKTTQTPVRGQRQGSRPEGETSGGLVAANGDVASDHGQSSANESDQREDGEDCGKICFAFGCYFPVQVLVGVVHVTALILQQFLTLPFRLCGGKPLQVVLDLFCPVMATLTFMFVSTNHGEKCLGRVVEYAASFDDLLENNSAIKRKNIRRNQRAAVKDFEKHKIDVTFFPSGTWEMTSEIRDLIWHQCTRHAERAHNYADIVNCWQPVSPMAMYIGEISLLLEFPCDIQMFRTPDQKLVALNTRVHVGNMYFNPNYACLEEFSHVGIYAWSHWHMLQEAMRLRASVVNLMPSMRIPKKALGCRHLPLATLISACFSCTREPRANEIQGEAGVAAAKLPARQPGEGGKRAARKKAAAELAQAAQQSVEQPGVPSGTRAQASAQAGREQARQKKKKQQQQQQGQSPRRSDARALQTPEHSGAVTPTSGEAEASNGRPKQPRRQGLKKTFEYSGAVTSNESEAGNGQPSQRCRQDLPAAGSQPQTEQPQTEPAPAG